MLESNPQTSRFSVRGSTDRGGLTGRLGGPRTPNWIFIKGGCSRRAVQWMGVVLYSKTAYNIM